MKFNTLAKEQKMSVSDLAEKVNAVLPNANGGTEVSEAQKEQIIALLSEPEPAVLSLLENTDSDPILSILTGLIESEAQLENDEPLVYEMIARYIKDPEDLPTDPHYREAIIMLVSLVKKRYTRKQQQFSELRSLLSKYGSDHSTAEPARLERFYSSEPNVNGSSANLSGSAHSPQLAAASS